VERKKKWHITYEPEAEKNNSPMHSGLPSLCSSAELSLTLNLTFELGESQKINCVVLRNQMRPNSIRVSTAVFPYLHVPCWHTFVCVCTLDTPPLPLYEYDYSKYCYFLIYFLPWPACLCCRPTAARATLLCRGPMV